MGSMTEIAEFQMIAPVGAAVWGLLLVMGVFATATHLMFIQAYRLAPAGLLAPFGYFEIVSATALGLVLFGDFPDRMNGWESPSSLRPASSSSGRIGRRRGTRRCFPKRF